jgi:hypothetical protein
MLNLMKTKNILIYCSILVFTYSCFQTKSVKRATSQLQGTWVHSEDSASHLIFQNEELTMVYLNTDSSKYKILLTNKLSEFVDKNVNAQFLILINKNDTLKYEILGLTDSTLSMMYYPNMHKQQYKKTN